jgi:hypothetical protein
MGAPTFVFLYVGDTTELPTILVRSIRAVDPAAKIIQCSDLVTPAVEGVDRVARLDGDTSRLMTFRLQSFADLAIAEPAMYMDADMVCVRRIDPGLVLGDAQVAVCRREYGMKTPALYGAMDLSEYEGKTIGEVWPYVACCTVTGTPAFWADCRDNLLALDPKYQRWFGDQEAIRNVVATRKYTVRHLPESVYGHVPSEKSGGSPRLLHFKGRKGKLAMIEWAQQHRLF